MERELVELFEAAKKAADTAAAGGARSSGGPEVDRCLDVLNQLKDYAVTYDVLVSTQTSYVKEPHNDKYQGDLSVSRMKLKLSGGPNRLIFSADELWLLVRGEMPLEPRASWFSLKCIEAQQLT
ncbi:hypothetical protein RHGRI_010791 [Rhododendron griersonianum]|uniref:Uncharacterized protein n=1 Tax=Rhododendron griersonianum TaxID=479676 RepID=A0AAV6KJT6_9ERIC|nr:hypothetical protein RHGRI_010791 [Rhododendron griersonianum]